MTDQGQPESQRHPDWAALAIAVLLGVAAIVIGWSTAMMPGAAHREPQASAGANRLRSQFQLAESLNDVHRPGIRRPRA